jgi:DNA-binding MarR family transcriptional regulator
VDPSGRIDDDELVSAWAAVVDGVTTTQRRIMADRDAEAGFTSTWYEVLLNLWRAPDHRQPMNRLAATMADRIEEAGLIERQSSVSDRRITFVALTAHGQQAAQRASMQYAAALRQHVLGTISPDTLTRLERALAALQQAEPTDTSDTARPSH